MARPARIFLLLSLVIAAAGCSSAPRVTKVGESDFVGTSKVHRYKLPNGLNVLILEDHSSPTFAYNVWYKVGSRDEQKGLTGLAHLFEHMMFKETKNHKEGEFDRMLESAGAEGENAFTSRDYTGYVQSLPSDKLDLIASLEADRMTNLNVNEQALNTEREVVQNERRFRKENNPDGTLYERIFETAFTKHSYHWPVIGYESDLNAMKAADCMSFYKRFYAPNNATVVLVGDVNPDRAMSVIEKYYGPIPASKIDRKTPPAEPEQTSERVETKHLKIAVEKLAVGYHMPNVFSTDYPAIEAIRGVLAGGKGARLYRKLVDSGIATEVEVDDSEARDPGMFIVFVNMQKGKTAQQALQVIDKEIQEVIAGRVTQEEIDQAIAMHRFSTFDGLASNSRKAHFLGFYETVADRFDRGIEVLNALKSIDKNALARVAKAHLRKENRTVVIGVPAEKGKQ